MIIINSVKSFRVVAPDMLSVRENKSIHSLVRERACEMRNLSTPHNLKIHSSILNIRLGK